MKRKINYNKINIYELYQLYKLKNTIDLLNEIEISIPGVPIDFSYIPKSVSLLKFNYNFENKPYEIPDNIISIDFYEFKHLLEELPNTIQYIKIYKGFNHPIDKLGNNIKSLELGCSFNQSIDNLPTSLEKIVLSFPFTKSINNLPDNIKFIHIYNPDYNIMSIQKLPKSLILLQLGLNEDLNNNFDFTFNLDKKNYISPPLEKNNQIGLYSQFQYLRNFYFY